MSVNPKLGADRTPLLFMGENLLLRRERIRLISKIGSFNVKSDGVLYLSTLRLIFVADRPTESFTGLDIPLLSIRNEKFNQPLFGNNNLSMTVAPQANWGESFQFSSVFEFRNGGAQTFLRVFWKLMSAVNEVRNIPVATAVPPQVASIASGGWVQSAFVDPSDPTYIYTSQPYQPTDAIPQYYPTPAYVTARPVHPQTAPQASPMNPQPANPQQSPYPQASQPSPYPQPAQPSPYLPQPVNPQPSP
ncbi:hypothetical protein WA538_004873, partial [Blastocystis sp. DL]